MNPYWIEGLYLTARGVKKAQKTGKKPANEIEPYAKTIWADNAEEALQLATLELGGGQWIEGPKVGQKSEEQRMRLQGMPELPGFATGKSRKSRKRGNSSHG